MNSSYVVAALGAAYLLYLAVEAYRTYQRSPGDDFMTAFHGYLSILVARLYEAVGALGLVLLAVPEINDLVTQYLPPWAVPLYGALSARSIAIARMRP